MPWTCPACRMGIKHSAEMPRSDQIYRCPVCHLHMQFDPELKKMQPVPPNDHGGDKERKVA